jgi:threonine synthase
MLSTVYRDQNFYFSHVISKHFKKKIYLKLENQNLTGSHKDRECLELIDLALKKKYKKIGCASTGNLAISLAFYSKLNKLKCYIWLNKNSYIVGLLKELGAIVTIRKVSLKELYIKSNNFFNKNNILSANPGLHERKLDANRKITKEILKKKIKIQCIVSSVNNGSHLLGLSKNFKNPLFYGVYTKSKLAKSINSFSLTEINKRKKFKTLNLIKANDREIIKGFNLLAKEGLFLDGSSCAIVGSLNTIKYKNICCVLSGSALNNLTEVQKIISKIKN